MDKLVHRFKEGKTPSKSWNRRLVGRLVKRALNVEPAAHVHHGNPYHGNPYHGKPIFKVVAVVEIVSGCRRNKRTRHTIFFPFLPELYDVEDIIEFDPEYEEFLNDTPFYITPLT